MTDKINLLFEWIKDNEGFIHPNIVIDDKNKLKLSEKMGAKGVEILSIPRKLCLDSGTYKNFRHPTYQYLEEAEKKIFDQPFFKLILNLISEKLKDKNSFYYQFINSLPQMEDFVKITPLFYYNERKEVWKNILPTVIKKLDNLNDFYVNLFLVIKKIGIFEKAINIKMFKGYKTKEEVLRTIILWAFLIVNTYALDKSYLLPLFNFMHYNHETDNKFLSTGHKITFSYESINNEKLVINNGLLDNESLFTIHGYMNMNKKKYLEIKLSNKYSVENEDVKGKVFKTFKNLFDRSSKKYYISNDVPSQTLIEYLRIISINNRDMQFIEGDDKYFTNFISMDNEAGVYRKLLKIVTIKYNQIKKYDEKINKDDKNDEIILKKILKEQKEILRDLYYEIQKKWLSIMETKLDDNLMKELFKLS
jgi:hypothetical protein